MRIKLLLTLLALTGALYAQEVEEMEPMEEISSSEKSGLYFGVDLFNADLSYTFQNTSFNTSIDHDTKSKGFRLKMGTRAEDNWRVQGHLSVENIDDNIFSLTGNDGDLVELGADVIKAFELSDSFSLYILGGVSYGSMSVKGYNEDTINNLGLKLGTGVLFAINETLELTAGIDFKYRAWTDVQLLGQTIETSDSSSYPYLGINIHF